MTNVSQLIMAITPNIPFGNEAAAQTFLSQYSLDDQAAFISALYIGRDHIHDSMIQLDYVPSGMTFDRFFITGNSSKWDINPSNFARILYEKHANLSVYFTAFLRCVQSSAYPLATF